MTRPLVGIALAAYCPEPGTFREQLESIRTQTLTSWVCAVSFDSPLARLREVPELAPYFADPRFVFAENPVRLGHLGNFERAIARVAEAGVRHIACADQDDVWYPNKLEALVAAIERAPARSLVHSDMDVLVDGVALGPSVWELERRAVDRVDPASLLVRNVVTGASMLMDAALARDFPRIPAEALFHDHWYALVASCFGGVHAVHQRLHAYRQHADNVVGVRPWRGLFDGRTLEQLLASEDEAVRNFCARLALAQAALREGLPLPRRARTLFLGRRDGGLSLLALGVLEARRPSLARECVALAAGKALWLRRETSRRAKSRRSATSP